LWERKRVEKNEETMESRVTIDVQYKVRTSSVSYHTTRRPEGTQVFLLCSSQKKKKYRPKKEKF
jgi:hypothetical protein